MFLQKTTFIVLLALLSMLFTTFLTILPTAGSYRAAHHGTWCTPKISQTRTTENMKSYSSYNSTKAGVDTVGEIVRYYSCRNKSLQMG